MTLQMSDQEFRLLRDLIHRESGLFFAESKRCFLLSRIVKRVEAKKLTSFFSYYQHLVTEGAERNREFLLLLDLLTINETSFFRNRPQFDLLERVVLPELLESKASSPGRQLRIWSAGCSTGEEPYSIAISVRRVLPEPSKWRCQIFASDLSLSALERAHAGVYSPSRLEGVDSKICDRYFEPCSDGFRVREDVRRWVIFDFHNLKHDNGLRALDVIFCRNVLIYFDEEEQRKLLTKLIAALSPGGYLFLGHSESMLRFTDELEFVHQDKGTSYRKKKS